MRSSRRAPVEDLSKHRKSLAHLKVEGRFPPLIHSHRHVGKRGKPYPIDLSDCTGLGGDMLRKIILALQSHVQDARSINGTIVAVRSALRHLAARARGTTSDWSAVEWQSHVADWFVWLQHSGLAKTTCNAYNAAFKYFCQNLQAEGIIPKFDFPSRMENVRSAPKKTLAESPPDKMFVPPAEMPERYRERADRLKELAAKRSPESLSETDDILIELLREYAVDSVRAVVAGFEGMQKAYLEAGWVPPFLQKYLVRREPLSFRQGWLSVVRTDEQALVLMECLSPGSFPPAKSARNCINEFLLRSKGLKHARGMMHGTTATLIPFITLLLILLKNEVSSNKTLTSTSTTPIDDKTTMIEWLKYRAGMIKSAVVQNGTASSLDVSSSKEITAIQVVTFLARYCGKLKEFAPAAERDSLFICWAVGDDPSNIRTITDAAITAAFHRWRRQHPVLGSYWFSADKIRGTLSRLLFVRSGGDLVAVKQEFAHENLSTSQGYAEGIVTKS